MRSCLYITTFWQVHLAGPGMGRRRESALLFCIILVVSRHYILWYSYALLWSPHHPLTRHAWENAGIVWSGLIGLCLDRNSTPLIGWLSRREAAATAFGKACGGTGLCTSRLAGLKDGMSFYEKQMLVEQGPLVYYEGGFAALV